MGVSSGRGGKPVDGGRLGGDSDRRFGRSEKDSRKDVLVGGAEFGVFGRVENAASSTEAGGGVGGSAESGAGRCGGGIDVRCDDRGRCPRKLLPPPLIEFPFVAREWLVLALLTLRADELDARFE